MPDAAFPEAALIQVGDGTFYGTSSGGGAYGQGTVFKVTADGLVTVLHSFQQTMGSPWDGDGAAPQAPLVWGNDGNFYGTTNNPSNSTVTVFQMTPAGVVTRLVITFTHFPPTAPLILGPNTAALSTTRNGRSRLPPPRLE